MEDFNEFKLALDEFQNMLLETVKHDQDYDGEADQLLASIKRVKETIKDMNSIEEVKLRMGEFAWDFLQVHMAILDFESLEDELDELIDIEDSEDSEINLEKISQLFQKK